MTTQTFTWTPSLDASGDTNYSVLSAQFGDGYSQVIPDGINNAADSWPLTFVGSGDTIRAIKTFLDDTQGATSFYWTPPLRTTAGLFRCVKPNIQANGGDTYTLTVTFNEAFSP
ncbi:phage tail protein [Robbsia andropogonis]|uniref:phage tail protein n=1 Tax=Robbsia andropogonis TaxID=28092 RepID=UPI002A6A6A06|nr:phage tail protein [Robbsia andropogonis]